MGVGRGRNVQKRLDVEVVGSQDDLEKHLLVDLSKKRKDGVRTKGGKEDKGTKGEKTDRDKLLVPFLDVAHSPSVLVHVLVRGGGEGVVSVVLAVLQHLAKRDLA